MMIGLEPESGEIEWENETEDADKGMQSAREREEKAWRRRMADGTIKKKPAAKG